MDSNSALWNLGTIVQATATVFGLMIVAGIFYLQELKRHLDRTRWMGKHLAPQFVSTYRLSVSILIVVAVGSLLYLVVAGMELISDAMDSMSAIPGGDGTLSAGLSSEVSHRVTEFATYLAKVFLGVFTWFVGIIAVYTLDNLSMAKREQLRSDQRRSRIPGVVLMKPEVGSAGTSETEGGALAGEERFADEGSPHAENNESAPPK